MERSFINLQLRWQLKAFNNHTLALTPQSSAVSSTFLHFDSSKSKPLSSTPSASWILHQSLLTFLHYLLFLIFSHIFPPFLFFPSPFFSFLANSWLSFLFKNQVFSSPRISLFGLYFPGIFVCISENFLMVVSFSWRPCFESP